MKSEDLKNSKVWRVLPLICLIAAVVGIAFLINSSGNTADDSQLSLEQYGSPSEVSNEIAKGSTFEIYKDNTYGYSFTYPADWTVEVSEGGPANDVGDVLLHSNKCTINISRPTAYKYEEVSEIVTNETSPNFTRVNNLEGSVTSRTVNENHEVGDVYVFLLDDTHTVKIYISYGVYENFCSEVLLDVLHSFELPFIPVDQATEVVRFDLDDNSMPNIGLTFTFPLDKKYAMKKIVCTSACDEEGSSIVGYYENAGIEKNFFSSVSRTWSPSRSLQPTDVYDFVEENSDVRIIPSENAWAQSYVVHPIKTVIIGGQKAYLYDMTKDFYSDEERSEFEIAQMYAFLVRLPESEDNMFRAGIFFFEGKSVPLSAWNDFIDSFSASSRE
ncbi:MAG: hypothetical protein COU35_03595 [Candidatus Magasanikbacteria bacterium CG10_big_fil_rev_8_21_14_0_10_47_10]|uniref:Uncharacterized protein n=1 Tax=Candidatus Magasanikbacteria bacterium CG10_big_fil_rev_8_21_14_0_10_47_10 TaxID=1974652 RepID=A0A2H0TPZ1_9BACT|nr:MAG: hypothetical protein COU35_03595 [Candidatus Magasanikbacteria bacterium CG10_big_fil_rev_8_21_14_0_10_47_10]